jgi:hypothetical protein
MLFFFILLTGNWTTLKMLLPSPTQNFNNFKLKRINQIHNYLFIIIQNFKKYEFVLSIFT